MRAGASWPAARRELVAKLKDGVPGGAGRTTARGATPPRYKVLEEWPEELWAGLGKDFSLLSGFLDYKAEIYADAIDELKTLADDAAYVARRPEVLYYLGRSYYAASQFTKAVDALERYVRSQTVLGRERPARADRDSFGRAPPPMTRTRRSPPAASSGSDRRPSSRWASARARPRRWSSWRRSASRAGGAVGTTLATVCALGGQASYFGRLSDDEFGSMILRGLKAFGVDMSSVLIEPGKVSPTSFVLVDERTGRRLVRFTRGSTTPLDPGELPRDAARRRDASCWSTAATRRRTSPPPSAPRAKGVTVLLDARRLGSGMGELLDLSDIVIGNERFAAEFSHSSDMKRSLVELTQMGPRIAVITLGEEGVDRASRARRWSASPRCRSRSTTPTAPARCSAARSSTASSRAGPSTAASRSPTPPPRSTAATWAAPAASRR